VVEVIAMKKGAVFWPTWCNFVRKHNIGGAYKLFSCVLITPWSKNEHCNGSRY